MPKVTVYILSARTLTPVIGFPKSMLCTTHFTPLSQCGWQSAGECLRGSTKAIPSSSTSSRLEKKQNCKNIQETACSFFESAVTFRYGYVPQQGGSVNLAKCLPVSQSQGGSCHGSPEDAFDFPPWSTAAAVVPLSLTPPPWLYSSSPNIPGHNHPLPFLTHFSFLHLPPNSWNSFSIFFTSWTSIRVSTHP